MLRITISLPEDLAARIAREARRHGESTSAWVRAALRARLERADSEPRPLPFAALGRSGRRHTARDAEDILAREWGGGLEPTSENGSEP